MNITEQSPIANQPNLFDTFTPSQSRKHRQHTSRETAVETYERVRGKSNKAYKITLPLLIEFDSYDYDRLLTSREIFIILKGRNLLPPRAEVGYIRPRLTELLNLGCVENPRRVDGTDFRKSVAGYPASVVWKITLRGRELLECLLKNQGSEEGLR